MVQIVKSEVDFEKLTTNKKQTLRLKLIFFKLTNLSSLSNFNESIRENLIRKIGLHGEYFFVILVVKYPPC